MKILNKKGIQMVQEKKRVAEVSGVDSVYNKKGKIVGWQLCVYYLVLKRGVWWWWGPRYYVRRNDLFGIGHNALLKKRSKLVAQLDNLRNVECANCVR